MFHPSNLDSDHSFMKVTTQIIYPNEDVKKAIRSNNAETEPQALEAHERPLTKKILKEWCSRI